MKWTQLSLGAIQTNAYILENEQKEGLIIDPGDEADKIKAVIKGQELTPLAILLTHAHFDHIGALEEIRATYNIPVYLHSTEEDWLEDPIKNGSEFFPMIGPCRCQPADHLLSDQQELNIGHFNLMVIATPGHSPGSVSFYFKDEGVMFSGDALFNGSIGRTDLYGGNQETLLKSIKEKIFNYPDSTIIAPGHGFQTTIGQEKETNPFLL